MQIYDCLIEGKIKWTFHWQCHYGCACMFRRSKSYAIIRAFRSKYTDKFEYCNINTIPYRNPAPCGPRKQRNDPRKRTQKGYSDAARRTCEGLCKAAINKL
jgi:hypothetical protein